MPRVSLRPGTGGLAPGEKEGTYMAEQRRRRRQDAAGDVAELKNCIDLRSGEMKKLREMHRLRETGGGYASPFRIDEGSEAPPRYRAYTLNNFRELWQLERLSQEQRFDIEVVAQVLPFKTNNYVVEELIG
jgi:hypothetical protein